MTKLSLFLYGADALDSIGDIFTGIGIVMAILSFFLVAFTIASWLEDDLKNDPAGIWFRKHTIGVIVGLLVTVFGSFTISAAIPEKQTMYMIAGVEMANEFGKTNTAHELTSEMKGVLSDITGIIHSYAVKHGAPERTQEAK